MDASTYGYDYEDDRKRKGREFDSKDADGHEYEDTEFNNGVCEGADARHSHAPMIKELIALAPSTGHTTTVHRAFADGYHLSRRGGGLNQLVMRRINLSNSWRVIGVRITVV